MKLNIETTIRDNFKELNEACQLVDFSGDWEKFSSDQKVYFYKLIKADIDYAIEVEEEGVGV